MRKRLRIIWGMIFTDTSKISATEFANDFATPCYGQVSFYTNNRTNGIITHQALDQSLADAWQFAREVLGAIEMVQYRIGNSKIVTLA